MGFYLAVIGHWSFVPVSSQWLMTTTSFFCLFNLGILGNLAHFRHLFSYLQIPNKSIFQERLLGIIKFTHRTNSTN
jgi:hypothetical protein